MLQRLQPYRELGAVGMDMCAFCIKSTDRDGEGYAQKRTRIMSNRPAILEGLPRQCQNDHRHVILVDGRAGPAAVYSESFCDQVVKCVILQKLVESGGEDEMLNSLDLHDEDEAIFVDDKSGWELSTPLVRTARKKEIGVMGEMKVYDKIPKRVMELRGCEIIDVRWLDINRAEFGLPSTRCPKQDGRERLCHRSSRRHLCWNSSPGGSEAPHLSGSLFRQRTTPNQEDHDS